MTKLATGEDLEELHAALTLVGTSEHIGIECESANFHSLQSYVLELRDSLHVCVYDGERYCYDDGSYEVRCSVPGCWSRDFVEAES